MEPEPIAERSPHVVSRRRLLWLAGGAGMAATLSGWSLWEHPTRPAAASPAAPPNGPASTAMLCRDAWGANAARPGGTIHTPNRMTIHHTEVPLGANSNAPARLRQHQHYHQDTQGWIDIAYHLSVDRRGNIYELRDPSLVGDTATRYDPTGHFLVVCEGDFDAEDVTEEQLNGAALAFAWAAQQFNIATDTLAGHRDVSPEARCPGAHLYSRVTSGDLARRVDALLAAGAVDLRRECGLAAAERVAAIEAGN